MMDMMSEEEFLNIFFSDLIRNSVFVMEFESMLLVLNSSPDNGSHKEVSETVKSLIQDTSVLVLKILEIKSNKVQNE